MLALLATLAALATAQPSCHVRYGHEHLAGPDNSLACTPGSAEHLTRHEVCTHKDHPSLPASVRRDVLARYHRPNWTGHDGELDHRVPVFLGGRTTRSNIWPEPGGIPNAKDRLEFRVYRRVCFKDPVGMRVRAARRLFLADWRPVYRAWLQDGTL